MKEFKVRSNSTGPGTVSVLPLLCTEQYQAQQSKGREPACPGPAGRHRRDACVQCSLCALSVYPGMKGPIADLAFRRALEHPCQSGACGEEHNDTSGLSKSS